MLLRIKSQLILLLRRFQLTVSLFLCLIYLIWTFKIFHTHETPGYYLEEEVEVKCKLISVKRKQK